MAVFVCVADESYDDGNFVYGGFAAPVTVWDGCFAEAWNERVLNGPPQIPYLHMTEIRDWNWQKEHGLKPWQADRRVDAAADVICSTGGLVPVLYSAGRKDFAEIVRQPYSPGPNRRRVSLEPDYLCFGWFALTQLVWLHTEYGESVEKVDFWVEDNGVITRRMAGFHKALSDAVKYINRGYLAPLIGEFVPVSKDRIPAQAADMLAWHERNAARGKLDRVGLRRHYTMTTSGSPGRGRFGYCGEIAKSDMLALADGFLKSSNGLSLVTVDDDVVAV